MKSILRQAFSIFWRNPVLWAPVLIADFFRYWLYALASYLAHTVWNSLPTPPALGVPLTVVSPERYLGLTLAGGVFILSGVSIGIALYCYSLGILARLISHGKLALRGIQGESFDTEMRQAAQSNALSTLFEELIPIPKGWISCTGWVILGFVLSLTIESVLHHLYPGDRVWATESSWRSISSCLLCSLFVVSPVLRFAAKNVSASPSLKAESEPLVRSYLSIYATTALFCCAYLLLSWLLWRVNCNLSCEFHLLSVPLFSSLTGMLASLVTVMVVIPWMIIAILFQLRVEKGSALPPAH